MNILVLHTQVPFVTGGAEVLADGLVAALRGHGHAADIVALPLAWDPPERLLTTALAWSLLDLERFNDRAVDRVICTKYPTWAARHPAKSLWLVHQHRQAFDLYGTRLSELGPDAASREIVERVRAIDHTGINECDRRFGISRNVCQRLQASVGIAAAPLYPPVPRTGLVPTDFEPFVLSVARLDDAKRIEPFVRAMAQVRGLRAVIVGDGPNRRGLESLIATLGVGDRVALAGRVSDAELVQLYNTCRAVYYAPIDEDYGYTTVEALAAGKPVITAIDSGGVLEFIQDDANGFVCSNLDGDVVAALNELSDEQRARRLGASGPDLVAGLTWDKIVEALVG